MVKLSVVVVSRNAEDHIQRAIDSLETQTFKDFETIFIDSVSTDNTIKIIKKSKLRKKIICEKDEGIYDGMNKGLFNSSGDIVYFLNTDDYLADNDVFRKMLFLFDDKTIIFHGSTLVDYKGRLIDYYFDFTEKNLKKGIFPSQQCTFYNRKLITKLGGFTTKYKLAGDFDLFCKIWLSMSNGYFIKETRFQVAHLTPGGASGRGNLGEIELSTVIKDYFGYYHWFVWLFPKRVKTFFRNILIKANLIEWYRSTIGKNDMDKMGVVLHDKGKN
jgi:glycosyltransferase